MHVPKQIIKRKTKKKDSKHTKRNAHSTQMEYTHTHMQTKDKRCNATAIKHSVLDWFMNAGDKCILQFPLTLQIS